MVQRLKEQIAGTPHRWIEPLTQAILRTRLLSGRTYCAEASGVGGDEGSRGAVSELNRRWQGRTQAPRRGAAIAPR